MHLLLQYEILWTITGCSHGFSCLPCHCKYLHGTLWILSHSLISNTNQVVVQVCWWWPSATRKDEVNQLQEHLNSIDPHIKFTIELPGIDGLPFLDTLTTTTTPNSIESIVYRKPTHTDRYLDYNSNHPISAKPSVIHTFIHRAKQVCSAPEFLAEVMDHLHRVLQDNHYPTQFFQQSKPQQKTKKKPTHPQQSL